MDVGDWLRSLRLGQHEALFRENEIDAEVLPELTEADLEKIGVPLGHRKRLLKAIANLGAAGGSGEANDLPAYGIVARCRRAPSDHGDVLRLSRLDFAGGEARSRGLAQSGGELSRRRLGRSEFTGWPCPEEAR